MASSLNLNFPSPVSTSMPVSASATKPGHTTALACMVVTSSHMLSSFLTLATTFPFSVACSKCCHLFRCRKKVNKYHSPSKPISSFPIHFNIESKIVLFLFKTVHRFSLIYLTHFLPLLSSLHSSSTDSYLSFLSISWSSLLVPHLTIDFLFSPLPLRLHFSLLEKVWCMTAQLPLSRQRAGWACRRHRTVLPRERITYKRCWDATIESSYFEGLSGTYMVLRPCAGPSP